MIVEFSNKYSVQCDRREGGHYYIDIPIRFEGLTDRDTVQFIFDTGAYITVINNQFYEEYKLDTIKRMEFSLSGYNGKTDGYVYRIPAISVGGHLLQNVWCFSPKKNVVDGVDISPKQNLVGRNIIEHFRYYHDTTEDFIYFNVNPKPRHYELDGTSLTSGDILLTDREKGKVLEI